MRVLFLPAYFKPERVASDYLWDNLYEEISKTDIYLETYAPSPCRGISQELKAEYRCKNETLYNGHILVKRFRLFNEGKNTFQRVVRYCLCWIRQFVKGLKSKDIDLVFLASTPPIQGVLGALLKIVKKVPFVYVLQDIFPDSLVGAGIASKGSIIWKIGRLIENFTYKHADKIIVISEDFKKNVLSKGVPEERIEVIYNWVDQNVVVDISRDNNKLFDIYGLDRNCFYVSYNGNIGLTQNMDMLLQVAEDFQSDYPDIHFVLVGNGVYLKNVRQYVVEHNLINVHLLPFQPYEDIGYVFSLGDVSLVISKPGVGANSVPSKTWSIMSASRPVLASFDENELQDIIECRKCGIFTKAGDIEAFKSGIIALYRNHELCLEYGRNGRQFVMNNLTREVGTSKYVKVIKEVVIH